MKIILLIVCLLSSIITLFSADYTVSRSTYNIQAGDIDNDGDNDIVISHISNDIYATIMKNNGDGTFTLDQTIEDINRKFLYCFVDLDENPLKEFIFHNNNGYILIYYNLDFTNPYLYYLNNNYVIPSISSGDFDGDGDNDIVLTSYESGHENSWGLMYNLGNKNFSIPQWTLSPDQDGLARIQKIFCYDLDSNGFDDVIAWSFLDTYIYYFNEDGYTLQTLNYETMAYGLTVHDFDNDGDEDIVVGHWPIMTVNNFKVYENIGNQEFNLLNYYNSSMWGNCVNADINCDGYQDIAVVGSTYGISSFYNLGNLTFDNSINQPIISYNEQSYEECFSDFDGNGTDDLAIIRYGIAENNLTILYNNGQGFFMDEPQLNNDNHETSPQNIFLSNNYPNPFNPSTSITYSIPSIYKNLKIDIYNIKGEKIKSINCLNQTTVYWDGTDTFQNQVSSGIYIYMIKSNDEVLITKKMTLMK